MFCVLEFSKNNFGSIKIIIAIYRTAADYYDVVTTPIDLLKIQQKLKTEEYEDIDQLSADVLLMINNAKAYYKVALYLDSIFFPCKCQYNNYKQSKR